MAISLSRKPLSKAEKSLAVICVLVFLPLLGVVYVSQVRDAEPKWDIPAAAERPNPNGYALYMAAANSRVRLSPPVDAILDTTSSTPDSEYALKNFSLTRRQQWLKANAATFTWLNKALATASMAPDGSGLPPGDGAQLRELARVVSVRTHTFQLQHQPMRATMSALDAIQLGQDISREGDYLARLTGIAITSIGREDLDDWDATINQLNAKEARLAAQRLETLLARRPTAHRVLLVEKWQKVRELQQQLNQSEWRGPWKSTEIMDGIYETPVRVWQRQTTSKQTIYNDMVSVLDADIAFSKLPYSNVKIPLVPSNLDVFNTFLSSSSSFLLTDVREVTTGNMLLLRLALRAYIAEHGKAPITLTALAPNYLKSVPTDVYNDGKPLFYTRQGRTYKLWSVGPDGINNNGVPFARAVDERADRPVRCRQDSKGDFVAGLCR